MIRIITKKEHERLKRDSYELWRLKGELESVYRWLSMSPVISYVISWLLTSNDKHMGRQISPVRDPVYNVGHISEFRRHVEEKFPEAFKR